MIKEQCNGITIRTSVTRICDYCGKEEKKSYGEILYSKLKKQTGKDYCKQCGYKFRKINHKKGKESPFWTNGISLNKTSGYLRINNGGEYLHKFVYGEFLGRKLNKLEKVHHIDFDKLNNDVSNLFLCEDKSKHSKLHASMESCGYGLIGRYIWFDRYKKRYILQKVDYKNISFICDRNPSCACDVRGKKYSYIYISYRNHKAYHRYVMEKFLGRVLNIEEHVHHINGDTLDNDINNLVVVGKSEHKQIHNSLQNCVAELYKIGILIFVDGIYAEKDINNV